MKSGLAPFHAPTLSHHPAGFGGSPLDALYQRSIGQILKIHEAAFLESKSLVCSGSILGYHKRPLTNIAVREFELFTAPWQTCSDLLCPIHSLKSVQNFPWSINELYRKDDKLHKNARALTERHRFLGSSNLIKSIAWEVKSQDARTASKRRLLGSVRPPWDSSIYRDPLSERVADEPHGEGPASDAAGDEKIAAKDPFSSNAIPPALQRDISNQGIHATGSNKFTAEKSVQCGPGTSVQKHHGSRTTAKHVWVPPGLHIVGETGSREKGVPSERRQVRRKPTLALLSEGSITAQRLTRKDSRSAQSVLKSKPAARIPRIDANTPSELSVLDDTEARHSMPKSEKVNTDGNASRPFKSVLPAWEGQADRENVVDSGRKKVVAMAAASGQYQQNMQPCYAMKGSYVRGGGKSKSVREAAARKLAHLEAASSYSLDELEHLIEQQYHQLVASGVIPSNASMPQLVTAEQQRTGGSNKAQVSDAVRSTALSQLARALTDALHI